MCSGAAHWGGYHLRSRESKSRGALGFSLYILLVIIAAIAIRHFIVERVVVVGESMEPTLINGDNVLMEKLSYIAGKPKRYDIVVFPRDGALLIKRVYGLPGENIRIDESGMIYINGEPLDDRHAHEIMDNPGLAGGDGVTLDKGEYFVLGDNRNNSVDSRYEMVGAVSKKDIRGRVVWRLTPFDRLGKIK